MVFTVQLRQIYASLLSFACSTGPVWAEDPVATEGIHYLDYSQCLQKAMLSAADSQTLGEIREQCRQGQQLTQPLSARNLNETLTEKNPFVLTPHRLNYAVVSHAFNGINDRPFTTAADAPLAYRDEEVQFQLSFKFPLYQDLPLFGRSLDFYAAYTNRSFWQFFDDEDSIPFRETNHEPEAWVEWQTDFNFPLSLNLHKLMLGINHQSNGQSGTLSRGWNRVFLQGFLEHKRSFLSFKTWRRFDEQDEFDNSFNYTKYLGDFELEAAYKWRQNTFAITWRNQYEFNQYGAVQLEYTYPLNRRLKGYVQLFDGYGDSLIDMQYHHRKLAIGIVLADRI
ncbi:MAG: phospholipase A [Thiotrichales bacterium]|nr:phospholipase A [Thiotrichales bacterium]